MSKKLPPLGRAQIEALRFVNPEVLASSLDAKLMRTLDSLERRGLCKRLDGHWVITPEGLLALAAADGTPLSS